MKLFKLENGISIPTPYGFQCGYVLTHENIKTEDRITMEFDSCCYKIKGFKNSNVVYYSTNDYETCLKHFNKLKNELK